jgi:signal transduction histidine kinase
MQNKKMVQWEEITPYPTGTKVGIVTISPIYDDEGNCNRLLGTVHDITERKNAEEEILAMNKQLRNLLLHLENVREIERTNIAREIHDELGQQLTGLKMDASWVSKKYANGDATIKERLASMIDLIDDTVKTVRRIATELRPGILDDLGLIAAIEWQSQEFEKRNGIRSEFHTNLSDLHLERDLSTNIFRVYQEALTNILRHASATSVNTKFERTNGDLILTVTDNGRGFDINEPKNKNALGLMGMKERALIFQGEFTIQSEKLKGTTITLKVPFQKKDKQ